MSRVAARALLAWSFFLATACAGRAPQAVQPSPASPASPALSTSPSPTPSAHISPEGRLPVVGPPGHFYFACPTGEIRPRRDAPQEVRRFALRLLEGAGAPEPDPQTVWGLLDPSLQALFPSYEDFAREMRTTPYDATYDPWAENGTEIYGLGPTREGYGGHLASSLGYGRFCAPETEASILASYWMVLITWPARGPCAACYQELYFLTRPEGIRYWAAFP